MPQKNKIFSGKHVKWECNYHLVFVTKYRKKSLSEESARKIRESLKRVCASFEAKFKEFGWEEDHVHVLVGIPPKFSVSKLVNSLKGVSSRSVGEGTLWSPSYYVGTCGNASLETVKAYVANQRNSSTS